ncbi:hypothetical protein CNR22_19635 [Sphingobacteriaceae bacterium]|nr:hypothetical protein CNR22_19635 [Sphingobacteriaceae bacterium]
MWKVQLPDNTDAIPELFVGLTYVGGEPKHSLTAAEWRTVEITFERYDNLRGVAHDDLLANSLLPGSKDAIHDAYDEIQEKRRLSDLRSRLLLSSDRCPCCGISAADELDHHLPRSVYHALATYSRNLVPICHKCNNKKRTVTGENPLERFIHVYYDDVPQAEQFLNVIVTISGNTLQTTFSIIQSASMLDEVFHKLSFQIRRVNLDQRLKREVNTFLFSACESLNEAYAAHNNADNIRILLSRTARQHQNRFGLNDWRTVLLSALANNAAFCDGGFVGILNYQPVIID